MSSPDPEALRLAAVRALGPLADVPREPFERIARLAARLFDVPVSLVSLVDEERQRIVGGVGVEVAHLPRGASFCDHALRGDEALVVFDARIDPRSATLVDAPGGPPMGFYAGQAVHGPDGQRVGTLCIADAEPRTFGEDDLILLADLVALVDRELRELAAARADAAALDRSAGLDALTDLPGRPMVIDATAALLELQQLRGGFTCVVHLDVNSFKEVNDTLGHEVGDALICLLGDRIVAACPRGGVVGRPGGDEFLVLAAANGPQECIDLVMVLLAAVRRPVHLIGNELRVTASAGVATTTSSHLDAESLVRNAEIAMYQAKELGPDGFQVYEEELREGLLDRVERKSALRTGLRRREFVPWYQPELSIETGEIVGLEALARWQRGGGRPAETAAPFIELAEQTGLIGELGRVMLDQVCHQVRDWHEQLGVAPPRVWVNLSASQLVAPGTDDALLATLDRYGLAPSVLGVEITETALLSDAAVGIAALDHLSRAGVSIAVDDFGTGYSSLTYVKSHHVDVLKVDASFVRGLPGDPEDVAIVSATVALGSSLGMRIVAEGVETTAQLEAARNLGCTEAQGFLFTPALSADKVGLLLEAQPWRDG